jgi:PAS domain S-box-containing protein
MKSESLALRLKAWLKNIPIHDPVERRMATLLQVILIGLIAVVILATLALVTLPDQSVQEKINVLRSNLFGFLVVGLPLALLRRGYFRASMLIITSILFITPTLAITVVFDLLHSGGILFQFTLAIILTGLLVNRRALIITFGLSVAAVGFAAFRGQNAAPQLAMANLETALNFILFNGLIALFLDQFGVTLRAALNASFTREGELQNEVSSRKQTEETLRESEERYRKLIEHARDVIFTVSKDGRITSLSPSFEIFTGWSRAAWLGSTFAELVAENDRARAQDQFNRILHGETLRALRLSMHTRSGEILIVEMNISPQFKDDHVIGLLGIARDMTHEQQAEDALKASEKRFRALIENGWDAFTLADAQGTILYASPSTERLLGYTAEEFVGINAFTLFHPDDMALARAKLIEVLQVPGNVVVAQVRTRHKDGAWRWMEGVVTNLFAEPDVQALVTNYRDITERKQAEQALRESIERFEIISRATNDAVYDWNALTNEAWWNEAVYRWFGYKPGETVPSMDVWLANVHPDDRERVGVSFLGALERDDTDWQAEFRFLHTDGSITWTFDRAYILRDATGKPVRVIGAMMDITQRRQAEEETLLSQRRLMGLVTSALDGIISIDSQQRIVLVNPAAEKMFGYNAEELLGQSLDLLLPKRYRAAHTRDVDQFGRTGITSRAMDGYAGVTGIKKSGEEFLMDVSISQMEVGGQKLFTAIMRDVTGHKRAEKLQASVYEIARAAITTQTLDELYAKIHAVLQELLPAQYFYIALYDREKDLLSFPYFQDAFDVPPSPEKPGRGLTEYVLRSGKPILATRELLNTLVQSGQIELIGADSSEWLGVPLIVRDQVIGVMTVQSYAETVHFSAQDLDVMMYVSSQVASAIERKQAEDALRESETRYHHVLDTMREGCQMIDFDWRYLYVNEVVTVQQARLRPEEMLNHTVMELYPGVEKTELFAALRQCMEGRVPVHLETQFSFPDGRLRWFELSVQPVREGIFILSTDITERKQAEEKNQRQNLRLSALREIDTAILAADSVEDIVGAALTHIRELIDCRRAAMALIDEETNEVVVFDVKAVGQTSVSKGTRIPLMLFGDMFQPLSKNQPVLINDLTELPDLPPLFQTLRREGLRSICVLPLFSQGSQIGTFSLSSEIPGFFDEDRIGLGREVANQVAIAITQSRLIDALEERVREREKLITELTAKNAELENFTYTVSHDLKSPLVTMKGFLGYLEQDALTGNVERLKGDTKRIANAVDRMQELLSDLLELSRVGRFVNPPETVQFEDLARVAIGLMGGRIQENSIQIKLQPDLPAVYGDRVRLVEVLQNLLDNAAKHMGDQHEPCIEIGQSGEDAERGQPIFFVRDNGIGIAHEYHERVFGLFNKLDARTEGTGIGLALVKRIVEFHGGRIWVESEVGQGASFYFTLPKASL